MVEVPVTIEIAHDEYAAQAKVHWRLVADGEVSCGEDHFQFVRIDDDWKITSLLFYGVPAGRLSRHQQSRGSLPGA